MNTSKGFWAVVVIVILIVIGVVVYKMSMTGTPVTQNNTGGNQTQNIVATFACDGGKTISANFLNTTDATTTGNSVQLTLSDGREINLPQAISADGARYANQDESIVFWNVGNGATLTENGTATYANCVASNN